MATSSSTIIVKFVDDTVVMGLISDYDKKVYLEEIKHLENWCHENNLLLNVSKTKELIVDCSKKQERHYQPMRINGTTMERVYSFSTKQDRQALQRVVRSADRITHMELPDLQTIYYKQCQTKARRIVKDPTHPNNRHFSLLRSGKRFRSLQTNTETEEELLNAGHTGHESGQLMNCGDTEKSISLQVIS
ncbi:hypothetical protein P4O66_018698, partial [Electrophorus voltai]